MFRSDAGPGAVQPKSTCTHCCCNHIKFLAINSICFAIMGVSIKHFALRLVKCLSKSFLTT
ncbi:hypothetical protein K503DRAFT_591930 [Rhizopogon vinicolor AM-OR11-026]|uniref:Uncharacterized protein n=1 Tax=Rhizopogon vinicolor AM-OR11-026 TaxID=1314800 RepID=A0A1B7N727_9AGAM|nr:hypothetical protein K503DRAFT_591930 [Rhizopogon vinicolor AM-OR11-026]